jgi:hypothetical protein
MGVISTDSIFPAARVTHARRPASFLADENFSLSLVKDLRGHGCVVATVQEVGLVKKRDDQCWHWARRRGRVVLTHDHDFVEEWRFPVADGPGLAYLPQLMDANARLLAVRVMSGFCRSEHPLQAIKILFDPSGSLVLRTPGLNGATSEVPLRFEGSAREITRAVAALMNGAV